MSRTKVNLYHLEPSFNQEEKIDHALEILGLKGMKSSFAILSDQFFRKKKTPYDLLEALLEKEFSYKEDRRINNWVKKAKFPWIKTLDHFDFSYQPSVDERLIRDLASCRYLSKNENIIFGGPTGVGKTHLAIALGLEAINLGYEVLFLSLDRLIELIEKGRKNEDGKVKLLTSLLRPRLLILDEMDLLEIDAYGSNFLFQLLSKKYEKSSVIFTTNRSFTELAPLFGNESKAMQIFDRITHHCNIIMIQGESYRVKDHLPILNQLNNISPSPII